MDNMILVVIITIILQGIIVIYSAHSCTFFYSGTWVMDVPLKYRDCTRSTHLYVGLAQTRPNYYMNHALITYTELKSTLLVTCMAWFRASLSSRCDQHHSAIYAMG